MNEQRGTASEPTYDRALLLHGAKRNEVLTLAEVEQYGLDSFGDADYVQVFGMPPSEWYRRGIRLLGRTAVECTRDALADRIGRDVAALAARMPATGRFVVLDPFAGSCNTLYWILKHVPNSEGLAFELDARVFELTKGNIAELDRRIELIHGDYEALLNSDRFDPDSGIIVFVAPPWGTALTEGQGLDLRRTTPPITEIIGHIGRRYHGRKLLFATQVYEKVSPESHSDVTATLDWSELHVYDINVVGKNHGLLLGTKGWRP